MKLLFFQLKAVSYGSYLYFSEQLAAAFRARGHETVFFRASEEPLPAMERFCRESFDAVIDFNSDLPKLQMDDDSYFLDTIDAPFYDVILDHPLYHHDMLKQELNNFHIVCLDEDHRSYIEQYYPHIKSVTLIPMTGSAVPSETPFSNRPIEFLFTGSYTSPTEVDAAIKQIPDFMQDDVYALIDLMQREPSLSIEVAVKTLFSGTIVEELLPLHVHSYFLADTYLRAWERDRILTHLLASGLPLTLCGNGYEKAPFCSSNSGNFLPERTFSDTFCLMSQAKLCLNILPLFQRGVHDRIFSAMLNGAAVLTDPSGWIDAHFTPEHELFLYSPTDLDALATQVRALLSDEARLGAVAKAGQETASLHHTWEERCLEFENLIKN